MQCVSVTAVGGKGKNKISRTQAHPKGPVRCRGGQSRLTAAFTIRS